MRLFSAKHIWIKQEGETARVGISAYAQEKLGDIMFVNLPDTDEKVRIGQKFGDVESIKTVSDLISPADGTVTAVNEDVIDEPDRLNEDPYKNWLVELRVDKVEGELLTEEEYESRKEELG